MRISAIIQARTGSSRLPGKILMPLSGQSVLEHVISRVRRSKNIDEVIVGTTFSHEDLEVVKLCSNLGIRVFPGSEEDVLDRFYQISCLTGSDHIVRITADCPVIDPVIIDHVINIHIDEHADYTSNASPPTFPDGLDVECISASALKKAWISASQPSEREHVTLYIRNNPQFFSIANYCNSQDYSDKRWTLDENKDYEFLKIVYDSLYRENPNFDFNDILRFVKENPEVEKINNKINRNEGLMESILNDVKE